MSLEQLLDLIRGEPPAAKQLPGQRSRIPELRDKEPIQGIFLRGKQQVQAAKEGREVGCGFKRHDEVSHGQVGLPRL